MGFKNFETEPPARELLKIGISSDPSAAVFDGEGSVLGVGDVFSGGGSFFTKEFAQAPMLRAHSG